MYKQPLVTVTLTQREVADISVALDRTFPGSAGLSPERTHLRKRFDTLWTVIRDAKELGIQTFELVERR